MEFPADIRALLSDDGLVITANARAARALRGRYADQLERAGHRVWPAPRILDYDSWLQELWRELLLSGSEDRLLLNSLQEHSLWLRIVTPAVRQRSLISSDGVAALAQEAYALLADYGVVDRIAGQPWGAADSEVELFRQWARSFRAECSRKGWIARNDLPAALSRALDSGQLALPSMVGWLGFDRITAAQQQLIAAAERAGSEVRYLTRAAAGSRSWLYTAATAADELTACAQWCREQLERAPGLRIGVVVPDLQRNRAEIERTFLRLLAPESLSVLAAPAPSLPFEFSLGAPLAHMPLPRSGLLMLRWLVHPLSQAEVSWLLLSGFLAEAGSPADDLAMARCDAALREKALASEVSLQQWIRDAGRARIGLAQRLRQALERLRRESTSATPRNWCSLAQDLLDLAGWTGPRAADSVQFQTWTSWQRLLEQVASLDLTIGRVDFDAFLRTLEQAAAESIFAPESEEAPVQVSGVYESSGQQFDALWFLNADDTQWPPRGKPHPLLPVGLQREMSMPHASPEIGWQLATAVTGRVQGSAPACVFSYALQNETAELRCSPLLLDLPRSSFRDMASHTPGSYVPVIDTFSDDALLPWPLDRPAGGQDVLAKQAACPFQAFASRRLGARELSSAERGLSPAQRGNLLHETLESIWSASLPGHPALRSHEDLIAAEMNGTLQPLIVEHIRIAMRTVSALGVERWQQAYLEAEESRLVSLVTEWLALERARTPFTVEECEKRLDVTVGDLKLRLRADRIDRVADGRALLDYKTGAVTPNKWEGDRPQEPQLPLYAAYGGIDDLAGALLAQVRSGESSFKGRVRDPRRNLCATLKASNPLFKEPYSEELRDTWRDTLASLAEGFAQGEAQVNPKDYPKTCEYCAFASLCRVAETSAALRQEASVDAEPAEGAVDG